MSESQKWMLLPIVLLIGWIFYLLSPILMPFLVAAFLGYLGDPLVDKLEARKLSRALSVTIVFIFFTVLLLAILILLIPLLENQIIALVSKLPGFIEYLQTHVVPKLLNVTGLANQNAEHGIDLTTLKKAIGENWNSIGGIAGYLVNSISTSGLLIIAWISNAVLIPVIAFYFMRDWDILVEKIAHLVPRHIEPLVSRLARESDEVLAAFMRGQLLVMACLAIIYSLGLWIAGLELALLVGMLAGLVSFVPYLGFIVGILAAVIAAFMQLHDASLLLPIAIVFGIGQIIESMILTPLLVGDRIGLHPVAVIFAILVGGQLFGFVGVLIALPLSAVVMVLLRYIYQTYVSSGLYETQCEVKEEIKD
ncbi:MAG: AI-2E family transporter [gamma proteobacterium symbiont of Bathyaustriella thionipta]|nr:AI-2E family transporter [gamma proteobacterium symbiont of Bathyaustriella thionipta]MCU7949094.1 AI-2E family transporter [gamma proteobacterium symbiont of Bathyaustriella thionipta]MCU7952790.1 AI-2E family transporter [gamma proteobacterium symbiont of Bathyaustriella thionipta]MCU7955681.1 AI-2E family transporter [gamma proteobacterium symbiont of Bathyaustriella thionipta]MCU7967995.1 AI-2E family transporter [gamma proteobacterium symbiont of Bathyaustriella thionipta]